MAIAQYSELYWFPSGSVAANVTARVFVYSTNTLATLYADAGGTVPLANPLSTSGTGRLEFYAEEGRYWVHIDSEAFEIAVGAAAQPASQQDLADEIASEVARADAAYAAILHAASHAAAGSDPVTLTQGQITGLAAALAALAPLAGATFTGAVTVNGAFHAAGTALFSSYPSGPGTAPTLGVHLVDKAYTDGSFASTAHAASHASAGSDPVTLAQSQITGLAAALAALAPLAGATFTGSVTVNGAFHAVGAALFDSYPSGPGTSPTLGTHLVDKAYTDGAFAPIAHAASHAAAGSDPVTLTQAQITGLTAALAALAPLAGATFTGTVNVNAALNVTGYTTLAGAQANNDFAVFGAFHAFGNALFDAPVIVQNTRVEVRDGGANPLHRLDGAANTLGFHGKTPVAQQAVTGSRALGVALTNLLTALDTLGIIDDQTTV